MSPIDLWPDESAATGFADVVGTQTYSYYNNNLPIEYLNLTNGIDDDGDGWIDESCDGIDNDGDGIIDPGFNGIDDDGKNGVDDPAELFFNKPGLHRGLQQDRRERVRGRGLRRDPDRRHPDQCQLHHLAAAGGLAQLGRDDAAGGGRHRPDDMERHGRRERRWHEARLRDDPAAARAVAAAGRPVLRLHRHHARSDGAGPSTRGPARASASVNANSPLASLPFYHFWLTDREGVTAPVSRAPRTFNTSVNVATTETYQVPVISSTGYLLRCRRGTPGYSGPYLQGERRLVTLFSKTGQIASNSITNFSGTNTNYPYLEAQSGVKESQ